MLGDYRALDDNEELHGSHLFSKRIIGGFDWILDSEKELNVVFAIGNTKIVSKMVTRLKNKKEYSFSKCYSSERRN